MEERSQGMRGSPHLLGAIVHAMDVVKAKECGHGKASIGEYRRPHGSAK